MEQEPPLCLPPDELEKLVMVPHDLTRFVCPRFYENVLKFIGNKRTCEVKLVESLSRYTPQTKIS